MNSFDSMKLNSTNKIRSIVENKTELRDKLFTRGFIFTDNNMINKNDYPFYSMWKKVIISYKYELLVDTKQHFYIVSNTEKTLILIGHAYNPFKMCADEETLLSSLINKNFPSDDFWNEFNELTGIFTVICMHGDKIYIIGDPTCMQTTFYGIVNDHIYISSHTNLIGDLLNLEWDPYVSELSRYRFFPLLGNALPGNITQFPEIKRLVPNHFVTIENNNISTYRFFYPSVVNFNIHDIVEEASKILRNNMQLISVKWGKPAISMTGGCDSKTTLACTKDIYHKFKYFSYISSESEKVDAEAAHKICKELGLVHYIYKISDNDNDFENIEEIRSILEWNTGNITPNNKNDVRKRAFFANIFDFDVEVKSWSSEIGRAYYSKRFNGRKNFGEKPTPRKCTTLYKFFLNNRKLVKQTDKIFETYLNEYFKQDVNNPIEWQDQFFWEYRIPSWNGLVITGEHRYSFDITIPYNNRKLLQLLISVPLDDRIQDTIYKMIRNKMNEDIDKTGIFVINKKHTKNRGKFEDLYYILHSRVKI